MGCSGSRILDKNGIPIIKFKPNPDREKAILRYNTIMNKMNTLAKTDEDIILSAPTYIDSIKGYFETYKELFDKANINQNELYDGSQWYNIRNSFETENLDMYELFEDAFRGLYNTDDYDRRDRLIDEFNKRIIDLRAFSPRQKGATVESEDRFERIVEFMQFDKKAEDIEAIAFILKENQATNIKIIKSIAETIKYMKSVISVAIVINNQDEKIEEVELDSLYLIFQAVTFNVRIKAFIIISSFKLIKLSDRTKHTFVDMIRKNDLLKLFGFSKLDIDEVTYKQILKICSTHKNLNALIFDFKGKFNENYFNLFIDTVKMSKNITIGCFLNGDNVKDNDKRQSLLEEIKQKFLFINTSININ